MTENLTRMVPMDQIHYDDEFNCRGKIMPIDVADLARDIEQNGLHQPVLICPIGNGPKPYKLLAGFRRYTAHKILDRKEIECKVKEHEVDDMTSRIINLSENLNRVDLNPLQEAKALSKLRDLGAPREEIARRLNKTAGWVQTRIQILDMPEEVQLEIKSNMINLSQVKNLHKILKRDGKEAVYKAAKVMKQVKQSSGKAIEVPVKSTDPKRKAIRKTTELRYMINYLMEETGSGLHTMALAWAAGELPDNEFFDAIKNEYPRFRVPERL